MKEKDEKIKRIDIVFENCEVVELYPDMFTFLICEEINKSYLINCYQYRKGEFIESLLCKYFSIIVNKKGLNQKTKMGKQHTNTYLKDRLKWKDITHIDIIFKNRNEYIGVPWSGTEYKNELQTHIDHKDGLVIEIKEK